MEQSGQDNTRAAPGTPPPATGEAVSSQSPEDRSQTRFGELPMRTVGSPEPGLGRRDSDASHGSRAADNDNCSDQHRRHVGGRKRGAHRASKSVRLLSPLGHGHGRSEWDSGSDRKAGTEHGSRSAAADDMASPSLVRSSPVMPPGTLASRVTGMLRMIVLV